MSKSATSKTSIILAGRSYSLHWLRDHCCCPLCRDATSFQKIFDISFQDCAPELLDHSVCDDIVEIIWKEAEPHRSVYSLQKLLHLTSDNSVVSVAGAPPMWTADDWPSKRRKWHTMAAGNVDTEWRNDLFKHGFTLFSDVTAADFERFVTDIGPLHHTEFGRFSDVHVIPGATDISGSARALWPHTDYSNYMHIAPLLQFLYFKANDALGGETILIDGFRVASEFREAHQALFDRLVRTPVEFQKIFTDHRYRFVRRRPLIELDSGDNITGVFFNHGHCLEWPVAQEHASPLYEAYNAFFRYLKNPRYQLTIKMAAGQCVACQNGRVLHGRRAFGANSGERHLVDAYVDWDYLCARQRYETDNRMEYPASAYPQ